MAIKKSCEVLVIGAGPGGYVAAIRLGQLGKKVILVEKQWLGGTCLNVGCIPSKALIHAADMLYKVQHSQKMGIESSDVKVDAVKMQQWKEDVVKKLRSGIEFLCKANKAEVIMGSATLSSNHSAKVKLNSPIDNEQEAEIEFEKAILATGSVPISVNGIDFDGNLIISSSEALSLKEVPKKIVVMGGGYIGIEIGTFFAKVGSQVTIVEKLHDILLLTDRDVVEVVKKRKEELGVKVMTNTEIMSVAKADGKVTVTVKDTATGAQSNLEADKLFVAVGRKPLADGLGIENTKIQKDERGFVKVNDSFATDEPNIYAIGDLIGNPMLAHKAFIEGKLCAEIIVGKDISKDTRLIPAVIFSDPEIAMVGLSESEAVKQSIEVKVSRFPFNALGRAFTMDSTAGFAKIVADAKSGKILGFHIVGPEASNLIGESTLALKLHAELEDIAQTVHAHPTLSEALGEAADLMLGKSVHFLEKKKA